MCFHQMPSFLFDGDDVDAESRALIRENASREMVIVTWHIF